MVPEHPQTTKFTIGTSGTKSGGQDSEMDVAVLSVLENAPSFLGKHISILYLPSRQVNACVSGWLI